MAAVQPRGNPNFYYKEHDAFMCRSGYEYWEDLRASFEDLSPTQQLVAYLSGQNEEPLSERGEKDYIEFLKKREDMREKVSKEVFGCPYLEEKDLEAIINECTDKHKRWAAVLETRMKSYRKSLGRAVARDIDKIMDNLVSSDSDINSVTAKVDAALGLAAEVNTAPIKVPAGSQNDDFFCASSTGVSELGQSIDGSRLKPGMFEHGKNRIRTKSFLFPEVEKLLERMNGKVTSDQVQSHANRLRKAQKALKAASASEKMTQTVFSHVLILALKSLLSPNIGVIQVTGMKPAKTNVEVCGEFLQDLNKKVKESKKRERDELSLSPPKEDNEESTYEPIPQPQTKKLKVMSDLVIIRDDVRKNEKNLRQLFLKCDVNIEMKAFESLGGEETAGKTQLKGESMVRADLNKGQRKSVLCSVLCDVAGVGVLIHELGNKRAQDTYYMSKWVTEPMRMILALLWVVDFAASGATDFSSTGFKLASDEDGGDSETNGETDDPKERSAGPEGASSGLGDGLYKVEEEEDENDEEEDEEEEGMGSDIELDEEEDCPGSVYISVLNAKLSGRHPPLLEANLRAMNKSRLNPNEVETSIFDLSTMKWTTAAARWDEDRIPRIKPVTAGFTRHKRADTDDI